MKSNSISAFPSFILFSDSTYGASKNRVREMDEKKRDKNLIYLTDAVCSSYLAVKCSLTQMLTLSQHILVGS